jgi:hypothetical protein
MALAEAPWRTAVLLITTVFEKALMVPLTSVVPQSVIMPFTRTELCWSGTLFQFPGPMFWMMLPQCMNGLPIIGMAKAAAASPTALIASRAVRIMAAVFFIFSQLSFFSLSTIPLREIKAFLNRISCLKLQNSSFLYLKVHLGLKMILKPKMW